MDRALAVEQALTAAAPDQLADTLAFALREHYGAPRAELRLADYAMHSLQPARRAGVAAEPVPVNTSAQGRAFGAQEPVVERRHSELIVHLPATLRGDRVGVVSVVLPADAAASPPIDELWHIATVTAREVILAGRETDRYEVERRAERLTLAAEMQWLLLPARSCDRPEFSLGAHLEPAYAIYGDGFDWSASSEHLTVAVINGMGEGVDAASLTNLAVSALRNARRADLPLADQASLAGEAVFAQRRGGAHLAALLLRFDLATGHVEVVDAGSPRAWRLRAGTVEALRPDAQMPLGMFGDTVYQAESWHVEPKDRLLIVSDGVYAVASAAGDTFDKQDLARTLRATRMLPPAQVPGAVLREVAGYHGGILKDDALVMCIDWHGRPSA